MQNSSDQCRVTPCCIVLPVAYRLVGTHSGTNPLEGAFYLEVSCIGFLFFLSVIVAAFLCALLDPLDLVAIGTLNLCPV